MGTAFLPAETVRKGSSSELKAGPRPRPPRLPPRPPSPPLFPPISPNQGWSRLTTVWKMSISAILKNPDLCKAIVE